MGVLVNQNDFTHGELGPRMLARTDLAIYMKGAQKLRNMVVIPQGGAKRRFGTKYITTITANANQYMLGEFIYDDNNSYLFVFTNLNIAVYSSADVKIADITTPWTGAMLETRTVDFDQKYNLMVGAEQDTQPQEIYRNVNDETIWTIAPITFKNLPTEDFRQDYDSITFTLSTVNLGAATLTSSAPIFVSAHKGGLFQGVGDPTSLNQPIGSARIKTYTNPSTVQLIITSKFGAVSLQGNNVSLQEVAWSSDADRGWPLSITFYEGRLVFGGAKSLKETIFMSVVNDYRNFDIGDGKESDSIQQGLDGDKVGEIKYVVGDKSLQIFTSRSEHTIPQLDGKAITPGNDAFRRQSNFGITDVAPTVFDNQTFFVKRGGRGVMSFTFDSGRQSYDSIEVSLVSPQVITNPVDSGVLSGSTTEDSNYLFIVNNDGTLGIFQSLQSENVEAWSLSETTNNNNSSGKFKRIREVDNRIYFLVERIIDGATVVYLEKLDFTLFMDCCSVQTLTPPSQIITGLDHLEGQLVQVRGDGVVLGDETVVGNQITIDKTVTNVEVGLRFDPLLTPMPVQVNSQVGPTTYIKKRIIRAFIDYYESLDVLIDGVLIPYREFGPDAYDQPPAVKTDIFEFDNLSDWERREDISITQTKPSPMTILGVGYEVSVEQVEES
ncbi:hypothetical protein LCGC14_0432810 [marine sediment metagenome]|uniref:Ubiquitin-activating enzyme E1 FCCH domain-containing protein n=1 Tax=marine sediment metagenome TaxID=412755 RepID=A0A0F9V9J7_9ZZZZ